MSKYNDFDDGEGRLNAGEGQIELAKLRELERIADAMERIAEEFNIERDVRRMAGPG